MRKHYIKDFERFLITLRKRKTFPSEAFTDMLHQYLRQSGIEGVPPCGSEKAQVTIDDLVFHLGSLMHPKKMIKCLNPEAASCAAKTLRKDLRDNPREQRNIIRVYHFLYRFSLERL